MIFNLKVIIAVSLVVAMGGVFIYWQMSSTSPSKVTANFFENVDLNDYPHLQNQKPQILIH